MKQLKRWSAAVLALLLLLMCLAGCSGEQQDKREKKTVKININAEPDSLDPWVSAASDTEAIFHNVFEGLTGYDEEGKTVTALASGWSLDESGKVYTFTLRNDVEFHNGKHMTSADVLYSYESLTGLSGGEPLTEKLQMIEKLEAPDDYTFVVTLKEPSPAFLPLTIVSVLPEGYEEQSTHPVGTGPFTFVEYTPSQRVVLEKNETYYGKAAGDEPDRSAKVDRVEVYIMDDSAAVVSALRSGQLDVATMLNADDAKVLEGEFDIYNSPQNMVQAFFMNNSVAPFDDVRVRQAVSYAINRKELIDSVFGGFATPVYSNFSPAMSVYYNETLEGAYDRDIQKAKDLLKEAGYENGFETTVRVPALYQPHIDTAQVLAQQLAEVGITLKIETVEWATWLDEVYSDAKYEATITGLTGKLDPDAVLGRFHSAYGRNFFRYQNPEYDGLIEEARVELDEQKRIEEYRRCQEILTEDAVAAFLTDPNLIVACRKDLKGFTFYPVTFYDFSKLYYE